jgi:hypothetical protein
MYPKKRKDATEIRLLEERRAGAAARSILLILDISRPEGGEFSGLKQ